MSQEQDDKETVNLRDSEKEFVSERFWMQLGAATAITSLGFYIIICLALFAVMELGLPYRLFPDAPLPVQLTYLFIRTVTVVSVLFTYLIAMLLTLHRFMNWVRRGLVRSMLKTRQRRKKESAEENAEVASIKGYVESKGFYFVDMQGSKPDDKK